MSIRIKTEKCKQKATSIIPVDTGRKFNVHKAFKRRPERPIYVLSLQRIVNN